MDQMERERFARNLAEMNGKKMMEGREEGEGAKLRSEEWQPHNRWAALRAFIAQTMEKKPELRELKS